MCNQPDVKHVKSRLTRLDRLFQGFRLYWVVPVLIGLYALFGKSNTPGFIFPAFVASIACGLALRSARYNPLSFVSISALVHAVSYPIAGVLNLMLPQPAVYEAFLWNATPLAMWASSVGMVGLALGARFPALKKRIAPDRVLCTSDDGNRQRRSFSIENVAPYISLLLTLIVVPVVLFRISKGFYFHSQVTGPGSFDFESAKTYAFLDYIMLLSYAGVFFQIRRYVHTRRRTDGLWALVLILISMMAFAFSGSRDATVRVLVVAFPAFWAYELRHRIKLWVLVGGIIFSIILIVSMQAYRYVASQSRAETLKEKTQILFHVVSSMSLKDIFFSSESQFILSRRLADYVATGWYIAIVPQSAPFRYLDNVQYWPALLLPVFIRPELPWHALQESASLTYETSGYGWHLPGEGSSPAMIIGDLYTRFGWPGIFFGMFLLGILLRKLDRYFQKESIQKDLLFVLLWAVGWKTLTQSSLTGIFIFFTRSLLIFWGISFIVSYFIQFFQPGWKRK